MSAFGPVLHPYREPSWRRFLASLVVAVVGLLICGDALFRDGLAVSIVFGLFGILAGSAGMYSTAQSPQFDEKTGKVTVKEGVLDVDGKVFVRKATRTGLEVEGDIYRVAVFEEARYAKVQVNTYSFEEAQAFIASLAIKEEPLASFRVAALHLRAGQIVFALSLLLTAASGLLASLTASPLWFLLLVVGLTTMRIPGRATIGADGFVLSYLGIESFVPFSDVLRVERDGGVVKVHRKDGRTLRFGELAAEASVDKMIARIERGRAAVHDTVSTEQLLTRGDRSDEVWREELTRLSAPGYRSAAVERDRLWEVFENPGAEASARRAAAFLLRAGATAEERQKLTRVVEGVVSPELREDLEEDLAPDEDAKLQA